MSKRIFLVSNWWGYEDVSFGVMLRKEPPTKEEACNFLGLDQVQHNVEATEIEEIKDDE